MIDQELKIKIVDYADGVLDESLKAEVEEILQSNDEANEFLNQLKSVEIELNSKFNTNEYHNFSRSVDHKIDDLLETKLEASKKNSFFGMLSNSFGVRSMVGTNIVTAALFLFIGTIFLNQDDANLTSFSDEMLSKDILVFRSSNDSISKEGQIQSILDDIFIKNIHGASGKIGSDQYELRILDTFKNKNRDTCLNVIFSIENQENTFFIYCKSESGSRLYKEI